MSIDEELRWRMSDEHIRRAMEDKRMIRTAMRECTRRERKTRADVRMLAVFAMVTVLLIGSITAKAVRTAKAEEARLRKTGAIVDRILVYDMDGNLIID